jgi:hypothetical protein
VGFKLKVETYDEDEGAEEFGEDLAKQRRFDADLGHELGRHLVVGCVVGRRRLAASAIKWWR